MDRFGYARTTAKFGAFVLVLLSASTQAGGLFAPQVFISAAQQSAPYNQSARSELRKAALQPVFESRQKPPSRTDRHWINAPTETFRSAAPLPPRLRF